MLFYLRQSGTLLANVFSFLPGIERTNTKVNKFHAAGMPETREPVEGRSRRAEGQANTREMRPPRKPMMYVRVSAMQRGHA